MSDRPHEAVVGEQYNPQAQAYLTSEVHANGEDLGRLARIVGARPQSRALDLGCGGGHVAFLLAPLVQNVAAYDLSDAMVAMVRSEAVRRGLGNLEARQGLAEQLPWSDATFDIVASRYSVHHWRDARAGLREARRVLKPGGLAVFIDVVAPGSPLLDTWLQSVELLRDPSHVRNYSVPEWLAMLRDAGLQVCERYDAKLRLEFSSWIKRMNTAEVHVQAIRSLQARASTEVAQHFAFESDGSFTVDTVLIRADG